MARDYSKLNVGLVQLLKKKVEDLRREKGFCDNILATMREGLDVVDEDLNIRFMNGVFLKAFGRKSLGKKCYDVYKDNKKQCNNCPLKKPIRVGETRSITVSGIAGGRTFTITHAGMQTPDGKKAILETFIDITRLKKAEKKMKGKLRHLKNLAKLLSNCKSKVKALKKKLAKTKKKQNKISQKT